MPVTRSLNLAPIVINKSHSVTARFDVLVPCIPSIPVYLTSSPLNAPLPINVSQTGASTRSTKVLSSSLASEITAPPPPTIIGLRASLIIWAAVTRSSSLSVSVTRSICSGTTFVYSVLAAGTSFVISTSTGPGLPVIAILNARRSVSANFVTSFTMKLCFVTGIVIPAISTSWKLSFPSNGTVTLPVMATIGTESIYAVAIPVTRFVAPGPLVAKQTPTLPVDLA